MQEDSLVGEPRAGRGPALTLAVVAALAAGAVLAPVADARRVPLGTSVWWSCADPEAPLKFVELGCRQGFDPLYASTLNASFDWMTPENEFKMMYLQPARGVFDFELADRLVAWAQTNNKQVRGHALIWGLQNPDWLERGQAPFFKISPYGRDELLEIMRNHIHTVMGHFRDRFPGVVRQWDVVNEAFDHEGHMIRNVWSVGIGPDYIEKAFQFAREADPQAKLYYNETGLEYPSPRRESVMGMVSDFRSRGVPIDGVGIQMHTGIQGLIPDQGDIQVLMQRFDQFGVEAAITEMDVSMPVEASGKQPLAQQAEIFRSMARTCTQTRNCTSFTVWGVGDEYSWLGEAQRGLLFDGALAPKHAYRQVAKIVSRPRFSGAGRVAFPRVSLRVACTTRHVKTSLTGEDLRRVRSASYSIQGRTERSQRRPFRAILETGLLRRDRKTLIARIALRDGHRLELRRELRGC